MNPKALMMMPKVDKMPIMLCGNRTELSHEMPNRTPPSLRVRTTRSNDMRQTMKAITRAAKPREEMLTSSLCLMNSARRYVGFLRMEVIQHVKRRMRVGTTRCNLGFATRLNGGRSARKSVIRIIVPMSEPHRVINVLMSTSQ